MEDKERFGWTVKKLKKKGVLVWESDKLKMKGYKIREKQRQKNGKKKTVDVVYLVKEDE
jgi:hypothetical protein